MGGKAAKDFGAKGDTGLSFFAGRGSAIGVTCFARPGTDTFRAEAFILETAVVLANAFGSAAFGTKAAFETVFSGLAALAVLAEIAGCPALPFALAWAFVLLFNTLGAPFEVSREPERLRLDSPSAIVSTRPKTWGQANRVRP